MKARKKSVIVEAVQWNGNNTQEILDFCNGNCVEKARGAYLYVTTLEGGHIASVGDYIIKGIKGEFYPCKPDIFEKTYDVVCDNNEIDVQLTLEEIELLELALEDNEKFLNRLIRTFTGGEAFHGTIKQLLNTNKCVSNKLQKQKEELENEKNND